MDPQAIFTELTKGLPKFDDGRINFTGVKKAPVLNVVVFSKGEILIVKRSQKVSAYKGLWNGISGFIDEPKSIEEFAAQELREELSISESRLRIIVRKPYEVVDNEIDRTWVVYPVLAELDSKPSIVLDWEHTDYKWINPADLTKYSFVKDFDLSVKAALSSSKSVH